MPTIALATCAGFPELAPDDQHLQDTLAARDGVEVRPEVWNDPAVAWDTYDHVVLRSTWDYPADPAEFHAWLERTEDLGVKVHNNAARVGWNLNKTYLQEVAKFAHIVPTHWAGEEGLEATLAEWVTMGWTEAVVKPRVSLNAMQTHRVSMEEVAATLAEVPTPMVQPFMSQILTDGEWSFVFFGGTLSHTVVKLPKSGDYRVQDTYGGVAVQTEPPEALRLAAEHVVEHLAIETTYARVDGVALGGQLHVMEVELIEPSLFLREAPGSAERLADAILRTP